jgi:hypothetical protein
MFDKLEYLKKENKDYLFRIRALHPKKHIVNLIFLFI